MDTFLVLSLPHATLALLFASILSWEQTLLVGCVTVVTSLPLQHNLAVHSTQQAVDETED